MGILRNRMRHIDGTVYVEAAASSCPTGLLPPSFLHPSSLCRPGTPALAGWWAEPDMHSGALCPCSALPLRMTRSFHRGIRRRPPFPAPRSPPRPADPPRTAAPRTAEARCCTKTTYRNSLCNPGPAVGPRRVVAGSVPGGLRIFPSSRAYPGSRPDSG